MASSATALTNCGVEHKVAISTVCGMLNHLVVQTTTGTWKCLEFLQQHNLGRASFVSLDKMAPWLTIW